jgi:hypothetical protein
LCLLATLMGKISLIQMVYLNCEYNTLSFSVVFSEKKKKSRGPCKYLVRESSLVF